jgi:hypothetical protein
VLISLLFGDKLNTGTVKFGLDGGVNWSSQPDLGATDPNRSWHLGFYFDIRLGRPELMLHTGVLVKSPLGVAGQPVYSLGDSSLDAAFRAGSVTTRLEYFDVPVLLKYEIGHQFYVEGGALLGLLRAATDEFTAPGPAGSDLSLERDVRHACHPLDAGLMVGCGYGFMAGNGIYVGLRFYQGLVDVLIDDSGPGRYNQSLYAAIGIPIGAGKK